MSMSTSSNLMSTSMTSLYHSARIESIIYNRSKYGSRVESDIESSKFHWTEQEHLQLEKGYKKESDREYFEMLKMSFEMSPYYGFFREFDNLKIGEKIAEGGQAEVYEATLVNERGLNGKCVVKVFKKSISLQHIQSQWPEGVFSWFWFGNYDPNIVEETLLTPLEWIQGGTLLKNENFENRFAMVMWRQWGDLRKLIDERMILKNHINPFFCYNQIITFMWSIAQDMDILHEYYGIIHKDLKASNVLIRPWNNNIPIDGSYEFSTIVADFECSMGVVGTRFWRAPEILLQLKNGVLSSNLEFTNKADVYSYGMMCYEIVTGCIPFEDYPSSHYDEVLNGQRPKLPCDLHPLIEDIITSCWHSDPLHRPSFHDILDEIMRAHPHMSHCSIF